MTPVSKSSAAKAAKKSSSSKSVKVVGRGGVATTDPLADPALVRKLVEAARAVQKRAYAPYSKFYVGAALLTDKGMIVAGCNVENGSYPLSVCAERNAIATCVALNAGTPIGCVVVGITKKPLTPCGGCRQVLAEFNPDLVVLCVGTKGAEARFRVSELLPARFSLAD